MVIKRGEIWLIDFNPGFGTELHKKRPALIISVNEINKHHPRIIVLPISTKNYSGLSVVEIDSKGTGLDKSSVILPAEIRAIDKIRLIKKVGKISNTKLKEVEEVFKIVTGLTE